MTERVCRPWTTSELADLAHWYPEYGTQCPRWECNGGSLLTGRSRQAIAIRAQRSGVRCDYQGPKAWTKAQNRAALAWLAGVCRDTGCGPYAVLDHIRCLVMNNKRRLTHEG